MHHIWLKQYISSNISLNSKLYIILKTLINEWHFNLKWHWSRWYPKGKLCTQKYIRMTWLINNSLFTILRYLKNPLLFINVLLRIYILHIISTPTSITTKTKDIAQQLVKKVLSGGNFSPRKCNKFGLHQAERQRILSVPIHLTKYDSIIYHTINFVYCGYPEHISNFYWSST